MVQLYWSRQHVCLVNDWFPIFAKKKRVYGSVVKRMDIWKLLEKLYLRPQDPTCNSSSLRPCLPHLMASQPKQQVQWSSREARSCYRDIWGVLHPILDQPFAVSAVGTGSAVSILVFWKQTSDSRTVVWCFLNKTGRENEDVLCLRLYFWEASATKNLLCINFEG